MGHLEPGAGRLPSPRHVPHRPLHQGVYFDSQVTVGLLSNVTASRQRPSGQTAAAAEERGGALHGEILTAKQTAAARNFVNGSRGSHALLAHGLLYVGRGNLDYIQYQIDNHQPDAWKGYNISNAAKVDKIREPDAAVAAR